MYIHIYICIYTYIYISTHSVHSPIGYIYIYMHSIGGDFLSFLGTPQLTAQSRWNPRLSDVTRSKFSGRSHWSGYFVQPYVTIWRFGIPNWQCKIGWSSNWEYHTRQSHIVCLGGIWRRTWPEANFGAFGPEKNRGIGIYQAYLKKSGSEVRQKWSWNRWIKTWVSRVFLAWLVSFSATWHHPWST